MVSTVADGPDGPVAVIDIGSNSIRLVVYELQNRSPLPVFNEKVLCGLGRGLSETGRLSVEGGSEALESIARFAALADVMGVRTVLAFATAAVRDAQDGADFIENVRRRCGLDVEILSGSEEARLSGLGVVSGMPEARGVIGDLGGGSVELVEVGEGRCGRQATLPLGPLRVGEKLFSKPSKMKGAIDEALDAIDWSSQFVGQDFYAVGGAWRTVARIHMDHTNYPLHVIHHYTIRAREAVDFARFVSKLSQNTLAKVPGINKRRLDTIPYAALLLQRLLVRTGAERLVFSALGLREGVLFDRLPEAERTDDPLLTTCRRYQLPVARHIVDGDAVWRWTRPAFSGEDAAESRMRRAACLLSDVAHLEHPDYRAEHALMRVLRLPLVGIDHPGRAFVATAVASRHARLRNGGAMHTVRSLLDDMDIEHARAVGMGMRLAYTLSGGIAEILHRFGLEQREDRLILSVPSDLAQLVTDGVERRLKSFADALDCKPEIKPLETTEQQQTA